MIWRQCQHWRDFLRGRKAKACTIFASGCGWDVSGNAVVWGVAGGGVGAGGNGVTKNEYLFNAGHSIALFPLPAYSSIGSAHHHSG